jgi:S-adenosyl-L-methionine hydrolase (adenosine-forming)
MAIVTLTTDYGWSDFYTAVLKVRIVGRSPQVQIFDIAQNIEPFNIASAAYQVRNSLNFFPDGTIHCIDVASSHKGSILMEYNNQYILSFDNGIFSLILDIEKPQKLWSIKTENIITRPSFAAVDIFPEVIQHIINGKDMNEIAKPTTQLFASSSLKPIVHDKMIRASVIHVDSYQNVVINISQQEFEQVAKGRRYVIRIRRSAEIDELSDDYSDVSQGELVAFFNSTGYMELAMNRGNIAGINGLAIGTVVQIDFL